MSSLEASAEGLNQSFAMIRLYDQSVVVDLQQIRQFRLENYAIEILAHEIGHHVLAPANASDHFRLLAIIRRSLPTLEKHAAMVANLYSDLLINDRLQRQSNLQMHVIYKQLTANDVVLTEPSVWALYLRIYENLWGLGRGELGVNVADPFFETHAWLGAKLVRVYANNWLTGGARFAALLLPYLQADEEAQTAKLAILHDTQNAGIDSEPSSLVDFTEAELQGQIHPVEDPLINDTLQEAGDNGDNSSLPKAIDENTPARGQRREPFEYGEILRSAGLQLSEHEVAVRYYREAAQPYLIPFPKKQSANSLDEQLEGLEVWELGNSLDDIDWLASLSHSPVTVPGVTTLQRHTGWVAGAEPASKPIDLDIYVDSSGSMPNPKLRMSYMALAGSVICLSALRSGSRVQATLWSGKNQFVSTAGFVREENAILKILTGHFGGATAFPIHKLRDTFAHRADHERCCHILHISDDGITTLFDTDERGNNGWDIAQTALKHGRAGGTMALKLWQDWRVSESDYCKDLRRAERDQGWRIYAVNDLAQLVEFARDFARQHYGEQK